jgi:urease accessory protein
MVSDEDAPEPRDTTPPSTTKGLIVRTFHLYRVLAAAAAAAPTAVLAHNGHGEAQDAFHGFLHTISGLDHVLAMVAVGVIAAQFGGRALWVVPTGFVGTMAVTGVCAMAGLVLPGPEAWIALSVIALGAWIALPVKLPVAVVASMIALFAVFHGYSHGLDMTNGRSGIAFGVGFVVATALLHLAGIGVGRKLDRAGLQRGKRIARAGGSAVVMAGVVLLASRLT